MKKTFGILLLFLSCFLLIGINYAGGERESSLSMKSFSVSPPPGWTAEKSGDDGVTFRVPGLRSDDVAISITALPAGGPTTSERSWGRIRSLAIYRNGVPREGEERFSNRTWRVLDYGDELAGVRIRSVNLISAEGNTRYLIHFDCPESRYEALLPVFRAVKESFAPAAEKRA